MLPGVGPELDGNDVRKKFQISNFKISKFCCWSRREVLVSVVVLCPKAGLPVMPAIGGGVERDVYGGVWNQKRHSVSEFNGVLPPRDVGEEVRGQVDGLGVGGSKSFSRQTSVEKKSSGKDDIRGV